MTTHVFTGEGLNIPFIFLKNITAEYYSGKNTTKILKSYNARLNSEFRNGIEYKVLLRYIPHNFISKICSNIEIDDLIKFSIDELHFRYDFFIENIKQKYKNIPISIIKKEICYVLRDKMLKYFIYKLK